MADNYRALTRTYRPHTFDDIVSQDHVSNTLKNAIKQNRLSHAYMFCGPRGVGKTTMARVLARTINSIDSNIDGESLNNTLNIIEIDAASNNKVEDVHHLRESIRIPPQNGRYKVFIVDEVHMLSKPAFNALLKTLEEPPAHAIFIFATTEPHKVLPTILSRVQRFDFKRISVDEIVSRLRNICNKENVSIDDESLHLIARKADGALRDALGLMDQAIAFCGSDISYQELLQALNAVGNDQLFAFTDAVKNKDSDAGLNLVHSLLQNGVDIQEFLASLTEHLRNLYVSVNSDRLHLVDATSDTKRRYKSEAESFTEEDLMRMMHLVSEAQIKLRDVQQPKVHFEILLLKLIHLSRSRELDQLLTDLKEVKKNGWKQVADQSTGSAPRDESKDVTESNIDKSSEPNTGVNNDSESSKKEYQNNQAQKAPEVHEEPESKNSNGAAEEETPEDDFLAVKPTLGFARGISSTKSNVSTKSVPQVQASADDTDSEIQTVQIKSIDDIEREWESILDRMKEEAPRMLYLEMKNIRLKNLKGVELHVAVSNEFAKNIFTENEDLLASIMKKTIGRRIRFKCMVERSEQKKESLSPFERFKELQRKDPQLKTVVELFGAELEY